MKVFDLYENFRGTIKKESTLVPPSKANQLSYHLLFPISFPIPILKDFLYSTNSHNHLGLFLNPVFDHFVCFCTATKLF